MVQLQNRGAPNNSPKFEYPTPLIDVCDIIQVNCESENFPVQSTHAFIGTGEDKALWSDVNGPVERVDRF